ncbi:MAG: ABC transporter ATP-binding protein [Clostridia bacterium]|nr:ABC transporter ATP-binding protein [Clostridia bacterium]
MIKVKGVEKSYNSEKVLRGVSLEFGKGDFVSIMGESGSGKSTLLGIIGGFIQADAGTVFIDGKDVSALSEREMAKMRSSVLGFVFQSYALIPTLNVRDNIFLTATLGKKTDPETKEYAEGLIKRLGLSEMLDKYPTELSGGQCQRAAIIRALVYKPSIVILDEPTGALDSKSEAAVMRVLTEINRDLGTTVIQVTHSEKVAAYAKKIIRLVDGEIVL